MGTRDATPLMSQTMSHSKRKSARRTSERAVSSSMSRSLSTRQSLCVELLLSRTVMSKDLRFVELNMSLSAGRSRRFMMLRMMLSPVLLRLRRSVRMKLQAIPPTPNAPSGPRKFAVLRRRPSRSTLPSPGVPRNPERSVLQLDVDSRKEKRNVLMSPRRSAPGPEPTQGRSRSQLSRNGVTFHQRNLALPKCCVSKSEIRKKTHQTAHEPRHRYFKLGSQLKE